jgi:RNA polymerase sigma-70 factor (ECF subfamily)
VRRLPARQAQAIALRYVYDMPVVDVAAALECTEGTIKQHLSRAKAALARDLETPEADR